MYAKVNFDDNDINKLLDKSYMSRSKVKGLYNQNYYIFDSVLENQLVEEQKNRIYYGRSF